MSPDNSEVTQTDEKKTVGDDLAGTPFKTWPQVYGFVLAALVILVTLFWLLGKLFS